MNASFRARLQSGEKLLGTMVSLPSAPVAEILVDAGFEWLFIDTEHGPISHNDIVAIVSAARPCPCVIRVPDHSETAIKNVLDLGVDGIIVPLVNSAEEAARVLSFAKYPPQGRRSVGIARAQGYGFHFADYVQRANEDTAVVLQIEHIDGVRDINRILEVSGIDAIFLGPYDLSASLGKIGQIHDPEVVAAIDKVKAAVSAKGLPLGLFGVTADALANAFANGFSLLAAGTDTIFLGAAAREMFKKLKS
jgi:2-dehydro-3-deoxyglucarate aldolase